MIITTKKLGLAAFIKMKGGMYLGFISDGHRFETDKSVRTWEIEYVNSCCARHDNELIQLRKLMK